MALFIDEAHDLNGHTLIGLKRLMEVVEEVGGRLSVILAGHPKLCNDLRRPTMEEIGYRTDIFNLDGIVGSQRDYIQWLLGVSTGNTTEQGDILTPEAIDMLAKKLRTPFAVNPSRNRRQMRARPILNASRDKFFARACNIHAKNLHRSP